MAACAWLRATPAATVPSSEANRDVDPGTHQPKRCAGYGKVDIWSLRRIDQELRRFDAYYR